MSAEMCEPALSARVRPFSVTGGQSVKSGQSEGFPPRPRRLRSLRAEKALTQGPYQNGRLSQKSSFLSRGGVDNDSN